MRIVAVVLLVLGAVGCRPLRAVGIQQGEEINVQGLMREYSRNPVGAQARWEGEYVHVSGAVVTTGYLEKRSMVTSTKGAADPWGQYSETSKSSERVRRYPFVLIQLESDPTLVRCILESEWGSDLQGANSGTKIRVSGEFRRIHEGPPPEVRLSECRVRFLTARR